MNIYENSGRGIAAVSGSGIKLFMIHGQGVDHRLLTALDKTLSYPRIFERIYVDLPGMGRTEALSDDGGLPELAHWLQALIQEQAGTEPFALLGHSMGGILAQEMAYRFSDQVLAIAQIAPVVYPVAEQRTVPPQRVAHYDHELMASLASEDAASYQEMAVVQSPANWKSFRSFALPGIRQANLRAMVKLSKRYYLNPLPVARNFELRIPSLILCGELDQVCGYVDQRELMKILPCSELVVVPNAGHNPFLDQPEACAQAITAWLRAVARLKTCRSLARDPSSGFTA